MGEGGEDRLEGYTRAELVGVYEMVVKAGEFEQARAAVMLLKGEDWGDLVLPIFIGEAEARAIARALYGVPTQRPMTHDLIVNILGALGVRVERVTIDAMVNSVYMATITLVQEGEGSRVRRHYVDARPSDSVAIALRVGAPIYVNENLKQYAQSERGFEKLRNLYEP